MCHSAQYTVGGAAAAPGEWSDTTVHRARWPCLWPLQSGDGRDFALHNGARDLTSGWATKAAACTVRTPRWAPCGQQQDSGLLALPGSVPALGYQRATRRPAGHWCARWRGMCQRQVRTAARFLVDSCAQAPGDTSAPRRRARGPRRARDCGSESPQCKTHPHWHKCGLWPPRGASR
jgi:hypothetical protein